MRSRLVAVLLSAAMCASIVMPGTAVTALAAETEGMLLEENEENPAIIVQDDNEDADGDSGAVEADAAFATENAGEDNTDVLDPKEDSVTEDQNTPTDDVDIEKGPDISDETEADVIQEEGMEVAEITEITENEPEMLAALTAFEATGDGTESNPWKVSDIDSLNAFAEKAENTSFSYKDCYVELTADIAIPDGQVWYGVRDFNGTFNGNGHTISGLTIQSTSGYIGFFKNISDAATIQNLNLSDATLAITESVFGNAVYNYHYAGILAGLAKQITVSNCNIDGTVTLDIGTMDSVDALGGYVGKVFSKCTFRESMFDGTIDTEERVDSVGGFVGVANAECNMNSCVSKGVIAADCMVGGLFGTVDDGPALSNGCKIQDSRNEATVTAYYRYIGGHAGGLIGYCLLGRVDTDLPNHDIIRCLNEGNVTSESSGAGGIAGYANCLNITESLNEGSVYGAVTAGGLVGWISSASGKHEYAIKNCYNTGAVSVTQSSTNNGCMIVGYVDLGYTETAYHIVNCYANPSTVTDNKYGLVGTTSIYGSALLTLSNVYSPNGTAYVKWWGKDIDSHYKESNVRALNPSEMRQKSSFVGFDFGSIWKMGKNGPFLAWENKKEVSDSEFTGWKTENGVPYWYENGVKQGTAGRGKEIYDPDSDAWYWLDAVQGGAKAVSKDVYQESNGGKWVRYDKDGHMVKGWDTNEKGTYYFDPITGAMQKGKVTIDGLPCWFDENTGIGKNLAWEQVSGQDYYWYENGQRQGYDPKDESYRGKEIFDPDQNAWFWLDNNAKGKKAVSKDVYQPYTYQGKDNIGKWVRYDATGRMIKGWNTTSKGRYYFDKTTGAMLKGRQTIDGKTYTFNQETGILQ